MSFRNHRIVVASLFLPQTAALGEERAELAIPTTPPERPFLNVLAPQPKSPQPTRRYFGPLSSIVDDLTERSKAPSPTNTPATEILNPFGLHAEPLQAAAVLSRQLPPKSRKHQTTHTDHQHQPHRVTRKPSRSSSRRPARDFLDRWHIEANPHCNGGLKNAIASLGPKIRRKLWVGVLGTPTDTFGDEMRSDIERKLRSEHHSIPVWIPDTEFSKCYDEFCHQVLWPCLHYAIPDAPKVKSFYESESYSQYEAVNQRFANAIIENHQEGDIIWINDYHLLLLPSMIREKLPNAIIGFFLHVAFPSSEIFRCLAVRQKLLRGVLGADLVGFQTASFARHFRQTVSRILSLEALPKGIQTQDLFVDVAVFPMGIDAEGLNAKRREPDVAEWVDVLKERYAGKQMIVGRDKLDEVQGVKHKIQAFELFLEQHPEFKEKVVLIQVALQTTEENENQGGVADAVARINSRFSNLTWQPVIFLHTNDLTFNQYIALLTCADAFVVTSLREGMALRTHEYVVCQEGKERPLILSEFAGSYSYSGFRSCLPVNPWDTRATADAIHKALTMSQEDAAARWRDLHNHVVTQTAQAFTTSFLTRCLRVHLEHQRLVSGDGDTLAVSKLDTVRVLPRYKHSFKRLVLVDLEWTLWKRDPRSVEFDMPEEALDVLNAISEDDRNEVWILSGLKRDTLNRIADLVPKVGFCGENGCFIKPRPVGGKPQEWVNMVSGFKFTWKAPCMEILHYFSERTPGSYIEEREASVVWRYWFGPADQSSDRLWAQRQAAEAQNHIFDSLGERYGLRIIPGKNSFLVLPNNVSRSSAVGSILAPGGLVQSPTTSRPQWFSSIDAETDISSDLDFALAISSDEKLLRRLNDIDFAETVSTGEGGTDAKWKLDPSEVVQTLKEFAKTK